jgi:hypothetical protein
MARIRKLSVVPTAVEIAAFNGLHRAAMPEKALAEVAVVADVVWRWYAPKPIDIRATAYRLCTDIRMYQSSCAR